MQLISAIVRHHKVADICEALQRFGFHGLTVTDASGYGKRRGSTEIYRGQVAPPSFERRAKIEILASDDEVHDVMDVICAVASTGQLGDGKVWVTPIAEIVRIRTREFGKDAL